MKTNQCVTIRFQSWPADWWDFAYFAWDLSFAAMACIVWIERVTWNASYCSTWSWMEGGVASFGSRKFASCHEKRDAGSVISLAGWT